MTSVASIPTLCLQVGGGHVDDDLVVLVESCAGGETGAGGSHTASPYILGRRRIRTMAAAGRWGSEHQQCARRLNRLDQQRQGSSQSRPPRAPSTVPVDASRPVIASALDSQRRRQCRIGHCAQRFHAPSAPRTITSFPAAFLPGRPLSLATLVTSSATRTAMRLPISGRWPRAARRTKTSNLPPHTSKTRPCEVVLIRVTSLAGTHSVLVVRASLAQL